MFKKNNKKSKYIFSCSVCNMDNLASSVDCCGRQTISTIRRACRSKGKADAYLSKR